MGSSNPTRNGREKLGMKTKDLLGSVSVETRHTFLRERGSDTTSLSEQRGADTDMQGSRKARLENKNLALERRFEK